MPDNASYIDQEAALPRFCPDCGAGVINPDAEPGSALLCQMPRDWPASPECAECRRRAEIRMGAAGERAGRAREEAFWAAFLSSE